MKLSFFWFLIFSIVLVSSVLIFHPGKTLRLDSDYDSVFSYTFPFTTALQHGNLISVHPYALYGISYRGDPLSYLYNPLLFIPLILFGIPNGIYVCWILTLFFSSLTSFVLFREYVSSRIAVWGSLLYLLSGGFGARFAAGHVIFFLAFILWPVFFLCIFKKNIQIKLLSLLLGLLFYLGDPYTILYMAIFIAVTYLYKFFLRVSLVSIVLDCIHLVVFTSLLTVPKWYFFITEVKPVFVRFFENTLSLGSIHSWYTIFPFIIPLHINFYDRPFFQRLFGFSYNWYEYFVFLSPFPFLFLTKIRNNTVPILLFFAGILYIALKFPYSPFFLLQFTPVNSFIRVPQRILFPLSLLLIFLFCQGLRGWVSGKNRNLAVFLSIVTLITTAIVSIHTMGFAFETPRRETEQLIEKLAEINITKEPVLTFIPGTQYFLVKNKQTVVNFYHGWRMSTVPSFVTSGGALDLSKLRFSHPLYLLTPLALDVSNYGYSKIITNETGIIWQYEKND